MIKSNLITSLLSEETELETDFGTVFWDGFCDTDFLIWTNQNSVSKLDFVIRIFWYEPIRTLSQNWNEPLKIPSHKSRLTFSPRIYSSPGVAGLSNEIVQMEGLILNWILLGVATRPPISPHRWQLGGCWSEIWDSSPCSSFHNQSFEIVPNNHLNFLKHFCNNVHNS